MLGPSAKRPRRLSGSGSERSSSCDPLPGLESDGASEAGSVPQHASQGSSSSSSGSSGSSDTSSTGEGDSDSESSSDSDSDSSSDDASCDEDDRGAASGGSIGPGTGEDATASLEGPGELLYDSNGADERSTVFVRGIDSRVTEAMLWELFSYAGPVVRVHLKRSGAGAGRPAPLATTDGSGDASRSTPPSLAFIEFFNRASADSAPWLLAGVRLFGSPIQLRRADLDRVADEDMWTVQVRGLPSAIDEACLADLFLPACAPASLRVVAPRPGGHPRPFAFADFLERKAACRAILCLSGCELFGSRLTMVLSRRTVGGALASQGYTSEYDALNRTRADDDAAPRYAAWRAQGMALACSHAERLGVKQTPADARRLTSQAATPPAAQSFRSPPAAHMSATAAAGGHPAAVPQYFSSAAAPAAPQWAPNGPQHSTHPGLFSGTGPASHFSSHAHG
ncbi:hypothetical protein FNF29_00731 [Cafeteria roenbergensis]|uniref:RRM domain-containing protein n=1 Tax=Cafeteria roenbergensis TaxID=33653 RepID=A0A5A8CWU4_CAFRO|nr:hypothetical protein FNF29_00731 [Cafeteria roenbergensis]|eukprot:KAA0156620.1 hypothetical protein FNF29_00731 [Cafeteria roenbergensis]